MSSQPNVTEYMDAGHFLRDYYEYRKSQDPEFSYQKWASEFGFKNRSFLRLIVTGGRQITDSSRRIFARGLKLEGVEKEYFKHLVAYSQERNESKKTDLLERMVSITRLAHDQVEVSDHEEFLATPAIPALQVLLSFDDLVKTPANLAQWLGYEPQMIECWLELLERLGLARRHSDSDLWQATAKNFRVPEKLGSKPLQDYHASVLQKAIEAARLPRNVRRFRTLIVALSSEEYADFSLKMNEFAAQLLSKCSHNEMKDRELYFFTHSLFPVRPVGALEEKQEQDALSADRLVECG